MAHKDKPGYQYQTLKDKTEFGLYAKVKVAESHGWKLVLKEESKRWPKGWTATMERKK